jgi:hypothetical protein
MDYLEAFGAILLALGLKIKIVIASAFGAFISLRFFEGLGIYERWITFVGGVAIGSYASEPLARAVESAAEPVHQGLALGLGLFGMAIAAAVIKVIRETNWTTIVSSIVNFRAGGGK